MDKMVLRKGNLFNQLSNKIDESLIDSSQYDLEVSVGREIKYYRVRYLGSKLEAFEIKPNSFVTSKNHQISTQISEVANFKRTDFFWEEFPYKSLFQKEFFEAGNDRNTEAYYSFLQRVTSKKMINKYEPIYRFFLAPVDIREKYGVLSYDLDINLVRDRYYVVFFLEKVDKGFYQQEQPQYLIYSKRDFRSIQEKIDEEVLDLAIKNDYPLNLLKYVYIMTNGNREIISQFFQTIDKASNYRELWNTSAYTLLNPNVSCNELLEKEICKYMNHETEDINYSYRNKQLLYK